MEYYNKIAKSYNELHKEEQSKKVNIILKYIRPRGLLLDIGAGTGISTKPFEKYCMCIALDPSKELLKRYRGNKILAKAEKLPFKDKTFDVIISVTALHHTNIKKALKEIFRVAKPSSQIALTVLKKSKLAKILEKEGLLENFKKIDSEKDWIFIRR
ncbi:class I SAM-dependent methyltransferase [Candidatus Woesearchaeota archaeon]|nr:class I SAM-dependent methyltransferase [Candidatus Woesearchaeota archaeon]